MQIPQKLPCGPRSLGNYIMRPPVHKRLPMPVLDPQWIAQYSPIPPSLSLHQQKDLSSIN